MGTQKKKKKKNKKKKKKKKKKQHFSDTENQADFWRSAVVVNIDIVVHSSAISSPRAGHGKSMGKAFYTLGRVPADAHKNLRLDNTQRSWSHFNDDRTQ